MRRIVIALFLAMSAAAVGAQAQPSDRQRLPREIEQEVVSRWNNPVALRASDRLEIAAGREVRGDIAVLHGPLFIAGHVTGNVLAINADVLLERSARIDGNLLVVGGEIEGRGIARVDGSIRIYRQALAYREEGEQIAAADDQAESSDNWWQRFEREQEQSWRDVLRVAQAGPYNRVEGLPIQMGPAFYRRTSWGSARFSAAGVLRTGSSFSGAGDIGHDVSAEVRRGHDSGIGVGGRLFNVVQPVEQWQMSNLEVALASFLFRRDYRDYFQRHGGDAFVRLYGSGDLTFTGTFGEERWASRKAMNPFTMFNADDPWRANPGVDEGLFHIGSAALNFDTRTDPDDPWSGWFVSADVEHGRGTVVRSPMPSGIVSAAGASGPTEYTRGFFDVRRYNRLGPDAQFNMRVVLGGWLGGDPLPLERRLSVDGPGALPGFDFRNMDAQPDVATCNTFAFGIDLATRCERIALAQVEYRGDLRMDFTSGWRGFPRSYHTGHGGAAWVLFADAGRGWIVGPSDGTLTYGRSTLPPLSSYRSDIGGGLDFGGLGFYAAKALSPASPPVNFFVRLRHRF